MPDNRKMDELLEAAIDRLRQDWTMPGVGIVAAALSTPSGQIVTGTSVQPRPGAYKHAEAVVIDRANEIGLSMSTDIRFAVTLSPCIFYLPSREGDSCARVLQRNNIKNIYVGCIDKRQ